MASETLQLQEDNNQFGDHLLNTRTDEFYFDKLLTHGMTG